MAKKTEENISVEEMQAELKYAMPYHTGFVKGILEDWNHLLKELNNDKKYTKMNNDLKETIEILVFNSSAQSSIYESCDKYYRFRFDDVPMSLEERLERIEELNSARKEFSMCDTRAHYIGDILEEIE